MKLYDTNLPAMISNGLFNEKALSLAPEHIQKVFDIAVSAVAYILKNSKSKQNPVAMIVRRHDNQFIIACVVQYFAADDANDPGNWNMSWTWSEDDIPEDANKIELSNPQTHSYYRSLAAERFGMLYDDENSLLVLNSYVFEMLKKWLDENANESAETVIESPGLFIARVAVENGKKVFAFEADGEIKNMIKDDDAIEK